MPAHRRIPILLVAGDLVAILALSLIALVAARGSESTPAETNELSVKASGLN